MVTRPSTLVTRGAAEARIMAGVLGRGKQHIYFTLALEHCGTPARATGDCSKTAHTDCDFCIQTFGPKIQAQN